MPGPLFAHGEATPKRDRLELSQGGARLVLDYTVPAGDEASTFFRLFDRDHSNSLDEGEAAGLAEHLGRLASHFLQLSIDGQQITLSRSELEAPLVGNGADGLSVRVTLVAKTPLGQGPHTLRIWDRHKDRAIVVPLALHLLGLQIEGPRPAPLPMLRAGEPLVLRLRPTEERH